MAKWKKRTSVASDSDEPNSTGFSFDAFIVAFRKHRYRAGPVAADLAGVPHAPSTGSLC
jgi:hypothetical protein